MPGADASSGWGTYFIALAVIVVGSFLVTYLATDLARLPQTPTSACWRWWSPP